MSCSRAEETFCNWKHQWPALAYLQREALDHWISREESVPAGQPFHARNMTMPSTPMCLSPQKSLWSQGTAAGGVRAAAFSRGYDRQRSLGRIL